MVPVWNVGKTLLLCTTDQVKKSHRSPDQQNKVRKLNTTKSILLIMVVDKKDDPKLRDRILLGNFLTTSLEQNYSNVSTTFCVS